MRKKARDGSRGGRSPGGSDLKTILDSINDGVFTVDGDFTVTSFNRAAESITGVSAEEAVGRPCCEVFKADICEGQCALKQTIASGHPIQNKRITILGTGGRSVPISVSTALLRDARGSVIGGVETFRDLSLEDAQIHPVGKADLDCLHGIHLKRPPAFPAGRDDLDRRIS